MSKITATFSNGHVDEYKGSREVKAAWMITDKATGEVLNSGHSLDVERASKTAEGNVQYAIRVDLPLFNVPSNRDMKFAHMMPKEHVQKMFRRARDAGYEGPGQFRPMVEWCRARNAEYRAAQRAAVNIEVIAL